MADELLRAAFEHGSIEIKGQFTLGSNYTFLVAVTHEQGEYQAVYKPQKGEQPLWDFPENSLAGREVAAYLVSEALFVDPDGRLSAGSVAAFAGLAAYYISCTIIIGMSSLVCSPMRPSASVRYTMLVRTPSRKGAGEIIAPAGMLGTAKDGVRMIRMSCAAGIGKSSRSSTKARISSDASR